MATRCVRDVFGSFIARVLLLRLLLCGVCVQCQRRQWDDSVWSGPSDSPGPTSRTPPSNAAARLVSDQGVFARWREDLQGLKRPNSRLRQARVSLVVGQLTGFVVDVYDHPDLDSHHRPASKPLGLQEVRGNVTVFLGVPYALPPLGEGRFKPPRPHPGWQSWTASDYGPACPQPEHYIRLDPAIPVDEDCLFLNIFTPAVSSSSDRLYAVVFYIHGGQFTHGASNLFPAHMLAFWGQVVVVTFNYRLGALGFLSTGDEYLPGNYGLLDQAMALRWVHENIGRFGGDKRRITVYGDEAGAAAATMLAVAPKTARFVHQVIAQSGSALAEWAAVDNTARMLNTSTLLAAEMGCRHGSSYELLTCLRARTAVEIGAVDLQPEIGLFAWSPVVQSNITLPNNAWYKNWQHNDWLMLPDRPRQLYLQRRFRQPLRLMTGVNRDEAAMIVYGNQSLSPLYEISERFMRAKIVELTRRLNYTDNMQSVMEAINYRYTYWPDRNSTHWIRRMYINMMSDVLYRASVASMVQLTSQLGVETFHYVLNTSVEAQSLPSWCGVYRGVEMYFVTGAPFMDAVFYPKQTRIARERWTQADRNMSRFFMEAFASFAKRGRPNSPQILSTVVWQPSQRANLHYLSINGTHNSTMLTNYRQTEAAFWNEYLPRVANMLATDRLAAVQYWWHSNEPLQVAFWCVIVLCFLLTMAVCVLCSLWLNAKKRGDRLYEDTYLEDHFSVRENAHFAGVGKLSETTSLASMSGGGVVNGVASISGSQYAVGGGGSLARADARSVARAIQADRRRMGSRDQLLYSPDDPAAAVAFSRQPSRMSTRSSCQYATLEHTAPLAAVAPGATEARDRVRSVDAETSSGRRSARSARDDSGVVPSGRAVPGPLVMHAKSLADMAGDERDSDTGCVGDARPPRPPAFRPSKSIDQLSAAATPSAYEVLPLQPQQAFCSPSARRIQKQQQQQPQPPHQAQIVVQMKSRFSSRDAGEEEAPSSLSSNTFNSQWSQAPATSVGYSSSRDTLDSQSISHRDRKAATTDAATVSTDRSFDSADGEHLRHVSRARQQMRAPAPETAL